MSSHSVTGFNLKYTNRKLRLNPRRRWHLAKFVKEQDERSQLCGYTLRELQDPEVECDNLLPLLRDHSNTVSDGTRRKLFRLYRRKALGNEERWDFTMQKVWSFSKMDWEYIPFWVPLPLFSVRPIYSQSRVMRLGLSCCK